jgi:hypothetical protein
VDPNSFFFGFGSRNLFCHFRIRILLLIFWPYILFSLNCLTSDFSELFLFYSTIWILNPNFFFGFGFVSGQNYCVDTRKTEYTTKWWHFNVHHNGRFEMLCTTKGNAQPRQAEHTGTTTPLGIANHCTPDHTTLAGHTTRHHKPLCATKAWYTTVFSPQTQGQDKSTCVCFSQAGSCRTVRALQRQDIPLCTLFLRRG